MSNSNHVLAYQNDDNSYVIYNVNTKHEIYIGNSEYKILKALEHEKNAECLAKEFTDYSEEAISILIQLFEKSGLLDKDEKEKKHIGTLSVWIRDRTVNTQTKVRIQKIFVILFCISLPLFIFSLMYCIDVFDDKNLGYILDTFGGKDVFLIGFVLVCSVLIHEISHALCAVSIGMHVVGFSVGFEHWLPSAKVIMCGAKKVKGNLQLVEVYLAGINSNLILASICLFFSKWCNDINTFRIFFYGSLCNLMIVCINSNIFFNSDGLRALFLLLNKREMKNLHLIPIMQMLKRRAVSGRMLWFYVILYISSILSAYIYIIY